MNRIGIMGGTFDPIHIGHVMLGIAAKTQFSLDRVWFMPTGVPAYKNGCRTVTEGAHRAAMTALAICDHEGLELSEIELQRVGNTYTADTLEQLCREHPDHQYYYIVGADSLDYMDQWYHPEMIFRHAVVLAARRNTQTEASLLATMRFLQKKYQADIRLMDVPEIPISSSAIREGIRQGKDMSDWVDQRVLSYIQKHGLYLPVVQNAEREKDNG